PPRGTLGLPSSKPSSYTRAAAQLQLSLSLTQGAPRLSVSAVGFFPAASQEFATIRNCPDFSQHSPRGTGRPWGHCVGCLRNLQIDSVTSGERTCSRTHALDSICSLERISKVSRKRHSARRWRRM